MGGASRIVHGPFQESAIEAILRPSQHRPGGGVFRMRCSRGQNPWRANVLQDVEVRHEVELLRPAGSEIDLAVHRWFRSRTVPVHRRAGAADRDREERLHAIVLVKPGANCPSFRLHPGTPTCTQKSSPIGWHRSAFAATPNCCGYSRSHPCLLRRRSR